MVDIGDGKFVLLTSKKWGNNVLKTSRRAGKRAASKKKGKKTFFCLLKMFFVSKRRRRKRASGKYVFFAIKNVQRTLLNHFPGSLKRPCNVLKDKKTASHQPAS